MEEIVWSAQAARSSLKMARILVIPVRRVVYRTRLASIAGVRKIRIPTKQPGDAMDAHCMKILLADALDGLGTSGRNVYPTT